jgi:hypothetical protein
VVSAPAPMGVVSSATASADPRLALLGRVSRPGQGSAGATRLVSPVYPASGPHLLPGGGVLGGLLRENGLLPQRKNAPDTKSVTKNGSGR